MIVLYFAVDSTHNNVNFTKMHLVRNLSLSILLTLTQCTKFFFRPRFQTIYVTRRENWQRNDEWMGWDEPRKIYENRNKKEKREDEFQADDLQQTPILSHSMVGENARVRVPLVSGLFSLLSIRQGYG